MHAAAECMPCGIPQVAVKVLNLGPDGAPDSDRGVASLRRVLTELVMLFKAAQHCQHVCRYHGVARQGNRILIVMTRYQGSLAALIRAAPGVYTGSECVDQVIIPG